MRKIFVIAAREYLAAIRTKSFYISLTILPVFMLGSIVVQMIVKKAEDRKEQHFAIVDRTPGQQIYPLLEEALRQRNAERASEPAVDHADPLGDSPARAVFTVQQVAASADTADAIGRQRLELSDRVRSGELNGFLDIGPEVAPDAPLPPGSDPAAVARAAVRYQSKIPAMDAFPRWAERTINGAVRRKRFEHMKLSPAAIAAASQRFPLEPRGLTRLDPKTGEPTEASETSQIASFLVPAALMMFMFMMVMFGASPMMQGVLEEKMQRIAEVLLGSVRPFPLMLGKLLGMIGVSLTIIVVYLAAAYWAAARYGFTEYLPMDLLAWFVLYQLLAVLMFGSVFIAIGAACTDMKETQTLMLPVSLLICLPLFVLRSVIQDPNSAWLTAVSFFPTATPMLMVARRAVSPGLPLWQPLAGVGVVLLCTLVCVYIAGRIFRVGMLMQGKGAKLSELIGWVVRG
jgi:ABC-2 type transport system permease protein